jgi:Tfp pilus assembly protein PilF
MKERARLVFFGCLLIAAVFAAYLPVLENQYIWDDESYVQDNLTLRSADGLRRMWFEIGAIPQYYPMVHTMFWVEYRLWGLHPAGYHLVNVLLHGIGAVLLWRILSFLGVRGAWAAALVFGLHPVHVESVAWITERKNVLSGVLYLSAALLYLRHAFPSVKKHSLRYLRLTYGLSLLFFVLALLSKTVTFSLPAAMLLVLWWKNHRIGRREIVELLPFLVVGVFLGSVTVWTEKHIVGAAGEDWSQTGIERVLIAGRALWFYFGKILWPDPLVFFYPRWHIQAGVWWQYLFPLSALGVMAALWWSRSRVGKGPLVGVLFFAGTLFPALGFFDVYPMRFSFVADHFQYLASIGPVALLVAGGMSIGARLHTRTRWTGVVALVLVGSVLGTVTSRQSRAYENLETLWRDTLGKNYDAWLAHYNLGNLLYHRGDVEEAMGHYRETLRVNPKYVDAYNNLGAALRLRGKEKEAIENFQRALRIDPDYAKTHNNLGAALSDQGRRREGKEHLEKALRADPNYAQAHFNLANVLVAEGLHEEAIQHLRAAVALAPGYAPAHYRLGTALRAVGRGQEAQRHLEEANRLRRGVSRP